jgi:hypothetical protein
MRLTSYVSGKLSWRSFESSTDRRAPAVCLMKVEELSDGADTLVELMIQSLENFYLPTIKELCFQLSWVMGDEEFYLAFFACVSKRGSDRVLLKQKRFGRPVRRLGTSNRRSPVSGNMSLAGGAYNVLI